VDGLLEKFGYVPHEHPLAWTGRLASGMTMVAFIPLLPLWARRVPPKAALKIRLGLL